MTMRKTGIAGQVVQARQAKQWTRADLAAATDLVCSEGKADRAQQWPETTDQLPQ